MRPEMGARGRLDQARRSVDRSREKEPVTSLSRPAEPGAGQEHAQGEEREDRGAKAERERGLAGGAGRTVTHVAHPHRKGDQEQQQHE